MSFVGSNTGSMSQQQSESTPNGWKELVDKYHLSEIHNSLGLTLEIPGAGEAVVHYDGSRGATNRRGNPAGGALAEMIDSAVVMAARTLVKEQDFTTTLEMKVNFVRSAEPGSSVKTHGRIDYIGRNTAVGTAQAFDDQERLVALGIVTVALRRTR